MVHGDGLGLGFVVEVCGHGFVVRVRVHGWVKQLELLLMFIKQLNLGLNL